MKRTRRFSPVVIVASQKGRWWRWWWPYLVSPGMTPPAPTELIKGPFFAVHNLWPLVIPGVYFISTALVLPDIETYLRNIFQLLINLG